LLGSHRIISPLLYECGLGHDGQDIALTQDGNILAVGATNHLHMPPYSGDALFVKLTLDGDVLWERIWGGDGYEQADSVVLAEDGGTTYLAKQIPMALATGTSFSSKSTKMALRNGSKHTAQRAGNGHTG